MFIILLLCLAIIYGAIGIACLAWPRRLQKLALRHSLGAERSFPALINLIGSWKYVLFLRAVGLASFSASLLLLSTVVNRA